MTAFERARAALKPLFSAVPKGKFGEVFPHAQNLETAVGQMANMLNGLRKHFLETTGEGSPFVKKIDELVPRGEGE